MKRIAMLLVSLALIVAPSSAFAQTSECEAYSPQTCTVSAESSTLPFTGLDVALLAVGGGGLLAAGLVVRRMARRPN
jgi:hypothetical protein